MSYPTRYRSGRGPQRGPNKWAPELDPLLFGGVTVAGIAYMDWALRNLVQQLGHDVADHPIRQLPGSYGWTLVRDCGFPPARLPAAGHTTCGDKIVSNAAEASEAQGAQNPMSTTSTNLYYFDRASRRFSSLAWWMQASQHWQQGVSGRNFSSLTLAGARPLGVRLPWAITRALGWREAGYDAAPAVPGRLPGFDMLDNRWGAWVGVGGVVGPRPAIRPDFPTRPLPRPVARAVPYALMREIKFNPATRSGRVFFAMYATFNLLGDVNGFTRALWFSLPKEKRGRSMNWYRMAGDVFKNWQHIDPLLGAANVAKWKFLDTLYGGTQGAMFRAIGAGYGFNLARVWSTLESEINATTAYNRRRLEREQRNSRG